MQSLLRMIILILTTWMVASIVSITGVISFVGLIAPHIAYLILKKRTDHFLLLSGCIGALIIMVGDMLARSLVTGAELPLSILTIIFSAPVLIFWMWKQLRSDFMKILLEVKNLSVSYEQKVVEQVSMTLHSQEIVGLNWTKWLW